MTGPRSVLVTGMTGLLGPWLAFTFRAAGWQVTGISRRPVPGSTVSTFSEKELRTVISDCRPELILNAAAMSQPAEAERSPEEAEKSNIRLPVLLAGLARETGSRFFHCSTDLVFDGLTGGYSETDPVSPCHVYGKTKAEAERQIFTSNPDAVIFRLALLIGFSEDGAHGFLDSFSGSLTAGKPVSAFTDEFRTAVPVKVAADLFLLAAEKRILPGLYHLAGDDRLNRYELARILARHLGAREDLIKPAVLAEFTGSPARQPDVSMRNQKLKSALGIEKIPGIVQPDVLNRIPARF